MALGSGSIAFTGYNSDGTNNMAFVALEAIAAGTVINFMSGHHWDGTAFTSSGPQWSWTAGSDVAGGTIVALDDLATATPTSNLGAVAVVTAGTLRPVSSLVYAFTGDTSAPTFLTAFGNTQGFGGGQLGGTGLTWGVNAISAGNFYGADMAAFDGSRANATGFADFLPVINNAANWVSQSTDFDSMDESHDGIAPDVPFSTTEFVVDPLAQEVHFAPGSLTVTQSEGDSGTTAFTFTVERTNGTTGEVAFSGTFAQGTTAAADFGGTLPITFSGTIPDGASSGTVTIQVAGERAFEADESFSLTLKSATNAVTPVYLSTTMAGLTATGTIVNDDTIQHIGFAPDSTNVYVSEGNAGTKTITFTIERTGTGGTEGEVTFSGTITSSGSSTATNGDDFGGVRPTAFSGTIPDGQTSTTVAVTISGDTIAENNERFSLFINSVSNPAADTIAVSTGNASATILNDDGPTVVHAGETVGIIGVSGDATITLEQGATVGGFNFSGPDLDAVINNSTALNAFTVGANAGGRIVFNNEATGVVTGRTEIAAMMPGSEFIFNNAGLFTGAHKVIKAEGSGEGYHVTINNLATGVIDSASEDNKAIVVSHNVTINNAGKIVVPTDPPDSGRTEEGGEAIEYTGHGVTLHNLAGGWIEGSHHAYTGEDATTVTNDAGGTMIGRNGSAVNIDNNAAVEDTVVVVNRGLMQGKSQNYEDSDGDAVDVDGRLNLKNWGTIEGLGHNGYHNGEPNVSEAIAAGAAVIVNYEGGTIYGYGRAIQIDNSGNEAAFAPTVITNRGLIKGDGNLPTNVTPEEVALFEQRIRGGEAVNIVGNFADMLTNTGTILGGVKMGGGGDTLTNFGTMTATGGSAIDMGAGNDTVTLRDGSLVTGDILLGEDDDIFRGSGGTETVNGGSGNDRLDGGAGADDMAGGQGNDTFYVDNAEDAVLELADAGVDRVISSITYALTDNIENLTLTGTAANGGFGNELDNRITGNDAANFLSGGDGNDRLSGGAANDTLLGGIGNDTLDGGTGADFMGGEMGDDVYIVDDSGDQVFETANQGTDRVNASIDFVLGSNLENLTLTGSAAIDGTGNGLGNTIAGNAAANVLSGLGGNDVLKGGAGSDALLGGNGTDNLNGGTDNDLLIGGAGNDTMAGGGGIDVFGLRPGFGADTIADFGADDFIDLRGFGYASGQGAVNSLVQVGGNVVLGLASGDQLTLRGVQKADLDADQFIVADAGTAGVPADVLALMNQHLV
jgi:Ca2+-binding RTX toxin-like protein